MLDRFMQSGGVHCYKVVKSIPKQLIKDCLELAAASAREKPVTTIRKVYSLQRSTQMISFTFFFTESRPAFLTNGEERNITYHYALIAEIGKYLFVSKSGARNFYNLLEDYVQLVSSDILMNAFIDKDSDIANFSAQTIGTQKEGVHRQSYKGKRLQKHVSTLAAANKALSNVQLEGKDGPKTIMGKAGRINARGEKFDAKSFIVLCRSYIKKFGKPVVENDFVNSFAIPLKFIDSISKLRPTEVLINTSTLSDYIFFQDNPAPRIYYENRNKKRYLSMTIVDLIKQLNALEEVVKKRQDNQIIFQIKSKFDKTLSISATGAKYLIKSQKFRRLFMEFSDTQTENIQDLINRKQLFNLTFDTPLIHYAEGKLWQYNNLLGNINSFLDLFVVHSELATITSEKGKPKANAKHFPANTLFEFVETNFKPKVNYLALDDYGYEVSDHVGIVTGKKVQLIHCKAKKNGELSASAFQEIVGQAQKNLNFFKQFDAINGKVESWKKNYFGTNITRMRKGDKTSIGKALTETLIATNADKEVYLVVNFLSFSLLIKELNNIKAKKKAKKSVLPLLWLLSGLRTLCLEINVKLYIYCKP